MNEYLVCPKCQSDDFGGKIRESEDGDFGMLYRAFFCDCGFEWQEVYKLISIETLNGLHKLDDEGNIIKGEPE